MIDLKLVQEIALANVEAETTEYLYRKMCRWYSQTYFVPLDKVETMSPYKLALTFFEHTYEAAEDREEMMSEDMRRAVDPEYDAREEDDLNKFIDMVEEEEENKLIQKNKQKQELAPKPVVKTFVDDTPEGEGFDQDE